MPKQHAKRVIYTAAGANLVRTTTLLSKDKHNPSEGQQSKKETSKNNC